MQIYIGDNRLFFFYLDYIHHWKSIAAPTVIMPATATERLLIAPSISPISIAFDVPMTCVAVPMAIPLAMGCFIRSMRHMSSPAILPMSPVNIIADTVMAIYPSSSVDKPMPMAVVMDLGNSVTYCVWLRLKSSAITKMEKPLHSTPDAIPISIAVRFFFSSTNCSYRGIANATVAGVNRYVRYFALSL